MNVRTYVHFHKQCRYALTQRGCMGKCVHIYNKTLTDLPQVVLEHQSGIKQGRIQRFVKEGAPVSGPCCHRTSVQAHGASYTL